MSARKRTTTKSRERLLTRPVSNVFVMFDQTQIQEFKEAFSLIDQDKDGFITKDDLSDMFASLGKSQSELMISEMLEEASGPVNFTMFLTLFGLKMYGIDTEETLVNSFNVFDEKGNGFIQEDVFKECLMSLGDKFTNEEVNF